ncbi:Toluene-4-sulfonate monooxygenase system iron-sulfur subunit TsaM1 [Pigmentiphaga humi]|uniref:Toluene-4-sulfonate monooxygenase system iron-sulfur subunit TsaM1 n=1 Tax=Pigmentiphaga humi TaxID=2478468 RepID=A0A3P4AXA8_9BURK|nr:aromatic ring-hydroxylating dioxygenase subunit alpha [Pigmentiphaga humi]VCU68693.1 Toluene-4-sulfonate monooxygenase system iron-sulfur subunit TsaM1 [Pigmentiphaga humi]
MHYVVRNAWYVLAWSKEIGDTPFSRRVLDEPIVAYRKRNGELAALLDRCAHKLVPLSLGQVVDDTLQCGYHGLQFDGSGACVHVPGQDRIPPAARVRSFPVAERYGAAWIWMGDPERADPGLIHVIERYDTPGWAVLWGERQHHLTHYLNIVENLQDPAHTTYTHRSTIGNPASSEVAPVTEEADDHIVTYRWTLDAEPPPIDRASGAFEGLTDRCQYYRFFPPCVSRVDVVTMDAGQEHTEANMDRGRRAYSYKFLTPETDTSTHFFWMHVRNFGVGDADFEARLACEFSRTFQEDNVVTSAMQREQNVTGLRQTAWLNIDAGPARARRMIEKMAAAEAAEAAGAASPADAVSRRTVAAS